MAGNSNLHMSRSGKTDEFYTQLSTIEDELRHYRRYFRDKVIFCNADDPAIGEDGQDHFGDGLGGYTSNFFRYFQLNFHQLGIKKLITTHYVPKGASYKFEIVRTGNDNQAEPPEYIRTPLQGNGDFRSPECVELLKQSDIVVTNPPFSLMKEYVPLIQESGKQFLVLGNMNHITFKEIFHYFYDHKMWLGYNSGHFWFRVPDYYPAKNTDFKQDEAGRKWRRMGNICWFTNMDIEKRHEPLNLYMRYTPENYPKYDNFDAIHVEKVAEIPLDYFGIISVPITYFASHCDTQFEILGKLDGGTTNNPLDLAKPILEGEAKYKRIAIRRKPEARETENEN